MEAKLLGEEIRGLYHGEILRGGEMGMLVVLFLQAMVVLLRVALGGSFNIASCIVPRVVSDSVWKFVDFE